MATRRQVQYIDKVVNDSVTMQRQVPQSKCAAAEVSQFQFSNKEWWVPVVQQRTDATGAVLNRIPDVPVVTQRRIQVQRVQKKIEFTHVQHLGKMVVGPVVQVHRSTSWKRRLRSHQSQIVQ